MSSCTVPIKVSSMISQLKNPVWMQNRGSRRGEENTIFQQINIAKRYKPQERVLACNADVS